MRGLAAVGPKVAMSSTGEADNMVGNQMSWAFSDGERDMKPVTRRVHRNLQDARSRHNHNSHPIIPMHN